MRVDTVFLLAEADRARPSPSSLVKEIARLGRRCLALRAARVKAAFDMKFRK